MTDLNKITAQQRKSSLGFSEFIAMAIIVVLLIAVQGMFIAKHTTTLNVAAAPATFGVIAP
jgi:hypothetical protein